jgi:hypothetical protein
MLVEAVLPVVVLGLEEVTEEEQWWEVVVEAELDNPLVLQWEARLREE